MPAAHSIGGLAQGAGVEELGKAQEVQVHGLVDSMLGAKERVARCAQNSSQQPQRRMRLRPALFRLQMGRLRLQHTKMIHIIRQATQETTDRQCVIGNKASPTRHIGCWVAYTDTFTQHVAQADQDSESTAQHLQLHACT